MTHIKTVNWVLIGTQNINSSGAWHHFMGTASLFKWVGDPKKGQKMPRYGATYQIFCGNPTALICGGAGYIGDAIKKAFNIKGRLGGAKAVYTDWGSPIGKPSEQKSDHQDWAKGISSLIIF